MNSEFNHSLYDLKDGNIYLLVLSDQELELKSKENYGKACFLNFPFEKAIKVSDYEAPKGKSIIQAISEINNLKLSERQINEFGYLDKFVVVLFNELPLNDCVFLGTAGLDELSIIRLMRFGFNFLKLYTQKTIFIVENALISDVYLDKSANRLSWEAISRIEMTGLYNFIKEKH